MNKTNNKTDQAKELLSKYVIPEKSGAIISIVKNNETIFEYFDGMAELQYSIPINEHTKFNIATSSKMFIAAACIKLQQDGLISLDSPAANYLDEINLNEEITIRHLLSMSSGLYEGYDIFPICGSFNDSYHSIKDHLAIINIMKSANSKAGEYFTYNNTNYIIIAAIIEKVTGKHLDKYLKETIWSPLGMNNTTGDEKAVKIEKNLAYPYYYTDEENIIKGEIYRTSYGNGHIITNLSDLKIWASILKSQNCNNINLSPLFTPLITKDGTTHTYCLGMQKLKYKNIHLHGYEGIWEKGYANCIFYSPELDASLIILANSSKISPKKIAIELIELFFAENLDNVIPITNNLASPYKISGQWINPENGETINIEYKETFIELRFYNKIVELFKQSDGSFTNKTLLTKISIFPEEENGELKLNINWGGKNDIYINKNILPSPSMHLQEYVGIYHNSDLDAQHHVKFEKGKLFIRFGGIYNTSKESELIPITKDIFTVNNSSYPNLNKNHAIKFEREKFSGTISQIKLSTERTKNLILRKMKTF